MRKESQNKNANRLLSNRDGFLEMGELTCWLRSWHQECIFVLFSHLFPSKPAYLALSPSSPLLHGCDTSGLWHAKGPPGLHGIVYCRLHRLSPDIVPRVVLHILATASTTCTARRGGVHGWVSRHVASQGVICMAGFRVFHGDRTTKLERYRQYEDGPRARMARTN